MDEIFLLLAKQRIDWTVDHLRQMDGSYVHYVQVGGFGIHLPEGDFTSDKLQAALEEGYDRVMRFRGSINDYSRPIKPNKPGVL